MEGPRPIRAGELPSLVRLLNRTFRANSPATILDEYPHILNAANLGRLIVISEHGEIVSHAGTVAQQISFEGLPLAVALVGAVATAEECRGRGLATRCLDFALDQAAREGFDLAWISGVRSLYTSRGAARAGREWVYPIAAGGKMPDGMTIREFSRAGDFAGAAAIYKREPVRFLRSRDDWARAAKNRFVMNWKSRFWAVLRADPAACSGALCCGADRLCAYVIVHEPRADRPAALLAEFAGDRMAAARATPEAVSRMGVAVVEARVGDWDRAGRAAFAAVASADGKLEPGRGTFLPLRMAACMEKLRPRIARLCGRKIAEGLAFAESGAGPGSRSGAEACLHVSNERGEARIVGRAEAARFLFGAPDSMPPAVAGAAGIVAEELQPAFPLPTPWYGINFV